MGLGTINGFVKENSGEMKQSAKTLNSNREMKWLAISIAKTNKQEK